MGAVVVDVVIKVDVVVVCEDVVDIEVVVKVVEFKPHDDPPNAKSSVIPRSQIFFIASPRFVLD